MNAPGTAKRTTFLPFHASVESLVAIGAKRFRSARADQGQKKGCGRTDTARAVLVELRCVRDMHEGALGDLVADFDRGRHDLVYGGVFVLVDER